MEILFTFEQLYRSLQFASEISKQTLTLSTGVLALTVTFSRDRMDKLTPRAIFWLKASWLLLFLTIFFSLMNLRAYVGYMLPTQVGVEMASEAVGLSEMESDGMGVREWVVQVWERDLEQLRLDKAKETDDAKRSSLESEIQKLKAKLAGDIVPVNDRLWKVYPQTRLFASLEFVCFFLAFIALALYGTHALKNEQKEESS